jgi:hypothetical protein
MFRPISGHPQVQNWSLKHTEKYRTKYILLKSIYFYDFTYCIVNLQYAIKTNCVPEKNLQ